jgi:D-arabinan exo alpha-(1,3)/(1,5)-arabinofuranosidase (non-reducing end)
MWPILCGLKVEIENQHENGTPTTSVNSDDYTSLAFWYQEGSHEATPLPSFKERTAGSFPDKR